MAYVGMASWRSSWSHGSSVPNAMGVCTALVVVALASSHSAHAATCSVTEYGAKGDGASIDTDAINSALSAAQCDEIVFPSGHTFVSGTLILQSNKVGSALGLDQRNGAQHNGCHMSEQILKDVDV